MEEEQGKLMMKIVAAIVPYTFLPVQSGGQRLISGFYDELGKKTQLHVISTPENQATQTISYQLLKKLRSSRLRYADVFLYFKIKKYLKLHQIEFLIIEHPYLGWLGWQLKKATGVKLIVHTHNIEYQRFRSIGKWWWNLLKFYERWTLQKADYVFCITEEDKSGFIENLKINQSKCKVIPYGIYQDSAPADKKLTKLSVCTELNIDPASNILFFNGLLNYKPNRDALDIILHQINPILLRSSLNYKIIVAGKNLPQVYNDLKEWNQNNVIYLGFVDDIERFTKAADILLNPVLSGGGVKTKMIEALGLNTTVISTVTGAAGVSKETCGDKLIIIEDSNWGAFTDAVIKTVTTPEHDIPAAFYREFSWKNIIEKTLKYIN